MERVDLRGWSVVPAAASLVGARSAGFLLLLAAPAGVVHAVHLLAAEGLLEGANVTGHLPEIRGLCVLVGAVTGAWALARSRPLGAPLSKSARTLGALAALALPHAATVGLIAITAEAPNKILTKPFLLTVAASLAVAFECSRRSSALAAGLAASSLTAVAALVAN